MGNRQRDRQASGGLGLSEGRSSRPPPGQPRARRTGRGAGLPGRAGLGRGASAMSIDMICNNGKALAENLRKVEEKKKKKGKKERKKIKKEEKG